MANEEGTVSLYAVGDVCVNRDDPQSIFALAAPVVNEADIAFCQIETNYSERGAPSITTPNPLRAHPRNAAALNYAGFDVASLAGNHCLDFGPEALLDTIDLLQRSGIRTVGAGKNIAAARKPVIIEKKGIRTAFLAYNSILPQRYWAEANKAGCAPVRVTTAYEPFEHGQPGSPPRVLTYPKKDDMEALVSDVAAAKRAADVVAVSFHWGLHFTPAALATYQSEVAHATIDAGADLIIGTHSHILKPIEVYKGKVITYSLCNFAFDVYRTPEDFRGSRLHELVKYYPNYKYDPQYPSYTFPVDSRMTILLKCSIAKSGIKRVSFLPVYINPTGQPEILKRGDSRSREVYDYMNDMSKEFGTKLSFEGDEVLIQ